MPCSNAPGSEPGPPVAGVRLATLNEDDLSQVVEIESASFLSPWNREHFRFEIHAVHPRVSGSAVKICARQSGQQVDLAVRTWRVFRPAGKTSRAATG